MDFFYKFFSSLRRNKEINCLLISPPLLVPSSIYTAMPILTGQLLYNDINAKNFDLNIRFFRTILTPEYLEKTIRLLEQKNITYDKNELHYLIKNINNSLDNYILKSHDSEDFIESEKILKTALNFISKPYPKFNLKTLDNDFNQTFSILDNSYKSIKEMTFDKENNIFIDFFQDIITELNKQKIDFIGITVPFPATVIPALTLSRLLKEKTDIYVSLGGNFLSSERILNHPEILDIYCDSVLLGDGEESIVSLVKSLNSRKQREQVPGLIYKNKKNQICFNEPKLIKNMNNLANLSLEGINQDEYFSKNTNLNIMISKGCYWGKCNFCSIGPKYKNFRIKSPKKVAGEIKELIEKYNITGQIQFQDDALPPAYLSKLADEIINENLDITYWLFARLEKEFTKELFEKLYKSGLRGVFWGLESGCQIHLIQ